jgi:glycerol-3-phosphate acyltransferase PlsY
LNTYFLILLSYVIGATPTSYVVGKFVYGIDLRTEGSGNLGGTNAFRVLGIKAALPVIIVDVLKGWFPTWYFPQIQSDPSSWTWALVYGGAAILGHVFSFWIKFHGGKGVATSGGVLMAISHIALLAGFVTWLAVVMKTKTSSLGSLSAALIIPAVIYFTIPQDRLIVLWFTICLSIFVIWSHRSNIQRLLSGKEDALQKNSFDNNKPGRHSP